MADMVNQTLTQLFASSPPRGSTSTRSQSGDAAAREPFASSLDRSMARPDKRNDAPKTNNTNTPTAPAQAARSTANTPSKPADSAAAPTNRSKSDTASDASATDASTETDPTTTTDAGSANTDAAAQSVANTTAPPADLAASLAGTPAALAAASANPTIAVIENETDAAARGIGALATTLSNDTDPKARNGAGKAGVDLDAAVPDDRSAIGQDTADTADVAPNKLRATPFAAQLDARLEASGGRPAEPMTPVVSGATATALGAGSIHLPGADRPQAMQGALPMHVNTPASQPGWADAVGNRVLWLVGRDESRAELILTPPTLGKLEISITVSGDTTTAQFVAATPAAREALEQAMPRLREMFEQAGVTLAESNVNTASQDQSGERGADDGRRNGRSAAVDAAPEPTRPWLQRGEGMVDIFA